MRHLSEIIVHCSATRPDWMDGHSTEAKVAEIRDWHVSGNGWSDIGYHYIIDRDGTVAKGRPLARAGAHTRGRNANSVGVCLIGGHGSASTDSFSDNFTPEQDEALRNLLTSLMQTYNTISKVSGHNQYAAKACPGFSVPEWLG
jgi:N-acetyl-anhydromuramyl-L-alanine amidase AmpD